MDFKMTRQGVRDLNTIQGKPRGITLNFPPPGSLICSHPKRKLIAHEDGSTECDSCGIVWEK
jgi:hypothetical protein